MEKHGSPMAISIQVCGYMTKCMEMEECFIKTAISTWVSLRMANALVTENILGKSRKNNTKANGRMINFMGREYFHLKKGGAMKVNGKWTKVMGLV